MTKEEIHQIQGDTIHKTTIIVDSIIEATVMILKKNYYCKHYPLCQRQHKILNTSSFNFSKIQLYYAIVQNLCQPGLEAYLIIKMTIVILPKKIQVKDILNDTEYKYKSITYNKSTRNFEIKSWELPLLINEIENLKPNVISHKSNFTQEEYSALQS